jgi:chromodomain-helicase-DNA-binding protein 3
MGNKHSSDLNIVKNDLNDYYLSGFKFTSCNFEKAIDETEKNEKDLAHKDKYWDTLLDGEARLRTEKEFNELGKGKRVKKQYLPNY